MLYMALSKDEIQRINDLFKQLDHKEMEISSLRNELNTSLQTVNVLNASIEANKTLLTSVNSKVDQILEALDKKTTAKK